MRTMTHMLSVAALILAGTGPLALPADAGQEPIVVAQARGLTLEQAVQQVLRQYGGRIVSAHTEVRNGREVHVVRVLTDKGKVREQRVQGRRLNGRS